MMHFDQTAQAIFKDLGLHVGCQLPKDGQRYGTKPKRIILSIKPLLKRRDFFYFASITWQ